MVATSGIMISTFGSPPSFLTRRRRLDDRADLHRVQARLHDPEPHAAQAEHRVGLVQLVDLARITRASSSGSVSSRRRTSSSPRSSARATADRELDLVRAGTRAAAGRAAAPSPAARPSPGRCRRSPRAAAAAARRTPPAPPPSVSAKIIWRTAATRSSPRNMCSVRHRPIPSAPRSRAFVDWSGVSAFARTRSRRTRVGDAPSAARTPSRSSPRGPPRRPSAPSRARTPRAAAPPRRRCR